MSLISAEEIEVSVDENLGIGGGEVTQERNLEAEGLKQGEKMAGNHLDVTVGDDLPVLDAAVQQSLEENGELCGALHFFFSSSLRMRALIILPLVVFGSSSTKSTMRGYL